MLLRESGRLVSASAPQSPVLRLHSCCSRLPAPASLSVSLSSAEGSAERLACSTHITSVPRHAMESQDTYEYQSTTNELGYETSGAVQSDDPYAGLDEDGKAALQEEFRLELAKTEEEIATLRQVLASKSKHAAELKRKLGISAWKEWTADLGQGVKNLQETTAYVSPVLS